MAAHGLSNNVFALTRQSRFAEYRWISPAVSRHRICYSDSTTAIRMAVVNVARTQAWPLHPIATQRSSTFITPWMYFFIRRSTPPSMEPDRAAFDVGDGHG